MNILNPIRFGRTALGLALTACLSLGSPAHADKDPENFTMGNYDLQGSRSLPRPSRATLTRAAVQTHGLEVKWFAPTDHPVPGVPIVADGVVYVGTATADGSGQGSIYALDAETGTILNGTGQDGEGFKMGLDLFGGLLPGPGLDGGVNLDSGYFVKGGGVIHFGIMNDYSLGMQDVANRVAPYNNGICFLGVFGGYPPCPGVDYGHLVLINGDGTAELGRYSNANASIVSPVYLDDMIFVHEIADLTSFDNDKLLVIDASNPASPTLIETLELSHTTFGPSFSFGAQVSIAGGRIYTGSGFFSHFLGSASGLYSIGVDDED